MIISQIRKDSGSMDGKKEAWVGAVFIPNIAHKHHRPQKVSARDQSRAMTNASRKVIACRMLPTYLLQQRLRAVPHLAIVLRTDGISIQVRAVHVFECRATIPHKLSLGQSLSKIPGMMRTAHNMSHIPNLADSPLPTIRRKTPPAELVTTLQTYKHRTSAHHIRIAHIVRLTGHVIATTGLLNAPSAIRAWTRRRDVRD